MKNPQNRSRFLVGFLVTLSLAQGGCDALKGSGLAGLIAPGLTVVIENATAFTAVVDVRTGTGRNIVEDFFEGERPLANIGSDGVVPPRQNTTIRLACGDELELISFYGADFLDRSDRTVGGVDTYRKLRRDRDYDCTDTVYIRLTGTLLSFKADVSVEQDILAASGNGSSSTPSDVTPLTETPRSTPASATTDETDIGRVLDELFD